MTVKELKAWLEGFSEAIDGAPTEKQWELVKEKIAETQAETKTEILPIPERDYWPRRWPLWDITAQGRSDAMSFSEVTER